MLITRVIEYEGPEAELSAHLNVALLSNSPVHKVKRVTIRLLEERRDTKLAVDANLRAALIHAVYEASDEDHVHLTCKQCKATSNLLDQLAKQP